MPTIPISLGTLMSMIPMRWVLPSLISSNVSELAYERTNSGMEIGTMLIGINSIGGGKGGEGMMHEGDLFKEVLYLRGIGKGKHGMWEMKLTKGRG